MDQKRTGQVRGGGMELRSKLVEGSGALIFAKDTKRYLFLRRANGSYPMTWGLPGGKSLRSESMDHALFREIREELGGTIRNAELLLLERFVSENKNFVYHTYFISVEVEFVPILNEEHLGYAWLPIEFAPKPLHPGLIRTFQSESIIKKIKLAESNA